MAKVLLVDDNEDMLDTLDHLFRFYDFEVEKAANGKEGIEAAESVRPDLIILDALMPVLNGFDACKFLKNNPKTKDIPVIFLSANYVEEEHRVMGLELGADDYILKPFNAKELITKSKSLLHKKKLIERLRRDNQQLLEEHDLFQKELEQLRKKTSDMEAAQFNDSLTGLYNLEFIRKKLGEELERAKRYQTELSLVGVDVDFFHKVNDMFGEQTGDYILMRIANVILNNTRHTDVVARVPESNRFLIILPHTDETGAFYEAERIRSAIDQTTFFDQNFYELKKLSPKRKQNYQHITASTGLVELDISSVETPEGALQLVIKTLEVAKTSGRNQTVRFSKIGSE
ncbi:MAG: diguanylate cyclase [Calditrichia bacterium]